jgi:glutamate racemase
LVIVACNTAAAYAIRDRQALHPELKTLSVTIPGIEALISHHVRSTLFLSTTATRESGILPDLAYRYKYAGSIELKACPGLANLIEEDIKHPFSDKRKKEII